MPVYDYRSIDASGKEYRGLIEEDSPWAARKKLREAGQFPVDLCEAGSSGRLSLRMRFAGLMRVPAEEVLVFIRQLATLLEAGMPLLSALALLVEQSEHPRLRRQLAQLRERVNEGVSLADAMSQAPQLFSRVAINMVRAGETAGTLDTVLVQLADVGEKQLAMRRRVHAAMVYPLFMAVVGSGVLLLLMTSVMPNITRVFAEMQQVLPLPTRLLIAFSAFWARWWWLGLVMLLLVVFALRQLLRAPGPQYRWHAWRLRLPWWGELERRLVAGRLARTLGSLLSAGIPLVTALEIVHSLCSNVVLAEAIEDAALAVERGVALGTALRRSGAFPVLLSQMVFVGEQSACLDAMLGRAAESLERTVETRLMSMVTLVEPVMILCTGVIVGVIVLAVLLPIVELNQLVR